MSTPESNQSDNNDSSITFAPSWVASHVKGGTSTAQNDEREEAAFRDAETRRDEAARDKQNSIAARSGSELGVARTISEAVQQQKGLMYTHQPGRQGNLPTGVIPIKYINRFGEEYNHGIADLYHGTAEDPNELVLILFCPRCLTRKKHEQDCIVQIRQSNREFLFVPKMGMFQFEGELLKSLGVIEESERFSCSHCHWRARFDHNRVRED